MKTPPAQIASKRALPSTHQHPNPYTDKITLDNIVEMTLAARGQLEGQPNEPAYRHAKARQAALAARPKTTPHKKLVKACVHALHEAYPDASISIRNVGVMSYKDKRTGRMIQYRYGTLGESDIDMTVPPVGRRVCLECKVGRDGQRLTQERFQARVERAGAVYRIVRSVEEALAAVREVVR